MFHELVGNSCMKFLYLITSESREDIKLKDGESELERADFLIRSAMEEDEADRIEEAIDLYREAAELCINTVSYHIIY